MNRPLSKTQYTKGLQCGKALWLYRNQPELASERDAYAQAILESGTEFGALARDRFPGGVLIKADHRHPEEAVRETQQAIAAGANVLYEAAFLHDDVLVRVDVLVRLGAPSAGNVWALYEVKSGTGVEEVHIQDVAVQRHVLVGAGHTVARAYVVHANPGYVRFGELDLDKLFALEDVTQASAETLTDVPRELARLKALCGGAEAPAWSIGAHCTKPYECEFKAHCWKAVPSYSVFNLIGARMEKKLELYNSGVVEVKDVPAKEKLTAAQERQVEAARSGRFKINGKGVRAFLGDLRYPLAHLDFETSNPVVPPYDGLRPYSQMPFQASVRIQEAPTKPDVEHVFLGDGLSDPRRQLGVFLCDVLPRQGSILAYYKSFEEGRLLELAQGTSGLDSLRGALMDFAGRLQDLADPFRTGDYVHPGFLGRWSIKAVLPVLVPSLSYKTLMIQDGTQAMAAYAELRDFTTGPERRAALTEGLKAYCGQDTLAMVKILAHLYEVAAGAAVGA